MPCDPPGHWISVHPYAKATIQGVGSSHPANDWAAFFAVRNRRHRRAIQQVKINLFGITLLGALKMLMSMISGFATTPEFCNKKNLRFQAPHIAMLVILDGAPSANPAIGIAIHRNNYASCQTGLVHCHNNRAKGVEGRQIVSVTSRPVVWNGILVCFRALPGTGFGAVGSICSAVVSGSKQSIFGTLERTRTIVNIQFSPYPGRPTIVGRNLHPKSVLLSTTSGLLPNDVLFVFPWSHRFLGYLHCAGVLFPYPL